MARTARGLAVAGSIGDQAPRPARSGPMISRPSAAGLQTRGGAESLTPGRTARPKERSPPASSRGQTDTLKRRGPPRRWAGRAIGVTFLWLTGVRLDHLPVLFVGDPL